MISITINSNRHSVLKKDETIYKGDNNFSKIYIFLPEKFNDDESNEFIRSECSIEMRCYITENGYLSYLLNSSKDMDSISITRDLTVDSKIFKVVFFITHGEDTVGSTNVVSISVNENVRDNSEELVPRKDFDDTIREQRQTIERQGETITEQDSYSVRYGTEHRARFRISGIVKCCGRSSTTARTDIHPS